MVSRHGYSKKISVENEAVSCECSSSADTQPTTSTGSDDVALYCLGGWALLSVIKDCKKHIKKSTDKKEVSFLQVLTVYHMGTAIPIPGLQDGHKPKAGGSESWRAALYAGPQHIGPLSYMCPSKTEA